MSRNNKSPNVAELFASDPNGVRPKDVSGHAYFHTHQTAQRTRKRQRLTKIWSAIGDLARALVVIALGLWALGSRTLPDERRVEQILVGHIFESNTPAFQFNPIAAQNFASLPGEEIP